MTHHRLSHGRSLIELMIALVIASVVLAAVLLTSSATSSAGNRTDALGRLTESGQIGLQVMAEDVRMAGFSMPRYIFDRRYETRNYVPAGIRGCTAGFANHLGGGAATDLTALLCAGAGTTGGIAVTYEVDAFNNIPVAGGVPSDCRGNGLVPAPASGGRGNATSGARSVNPGEEWYWRVENRYYIAQTNNEWALFCTGNGGNPAFDSGVALVRGVTRIVATYGIARNEPSNDGSTQLLDVVPDAVRYMTAADIDTTWAAEPAATRWQRVVSVRVCLEVQGEAGSGDNGSSYRNCDGTLTTISDGRQRRAVTMTMNLRNRTTIPQNGSLGFGGV